MQVPVWHVSVWVQGLPSLHPVPFGAAGFEQAPVDELHVPATWHTSRAVQTTGFVPVHTPVWQVSVCVHAFASLHSAPLGKDGVEQLPVDGVHAPAA